MVMDGFEIFGTHGKPSYIAVFFQFIRNNFQVIIGRQASRWPEIIHPDGWGELDEVKRASRLSPVIVPRLFSRSITREQYLEKTIAFLQNHGKVVLVRLPMGEDYQEYEHKLYPEFSIIIKGIFPVFSHPV